MKTEARAGNRQASSQRARSHSQKPCLELKSHRDLDEGSLPMSYTSWTGHWQAVVAARQRLLGVWLELRRSGLFQDLRSPNRQSDGPQDLGTHKV